MDYKDIAETAYKNGYKDCEEKKDIEIAELKGQIKGLKVAIAILLPKEGEQRAKD